MGAEEEECYLRVVGWVEIIRWTGQQAVES
jgi:hypothetical protein